MLFILTGNAQTGKTRWLTRLIEELAQLRIPCWGVVAPGIWREASVARQFTDSVLPANEIVREKIGIDNVLLPTNQRIPFAKRSDLAEADSEFGQQSESSEAKLAWAIADEALAKVNAYFQTLGDAVVKQGPPEARGGLLVVDELGRLELQHGGGLHRAEAHRTRLDNPMAPCAYCGSTMAHRCSARAI